MKYVRNLALLAVVMLLTWSIGGGTAFGQAYTILTPPYDTVWNQANDVPLLKAELTGFGGDTLVSVKVRSYIEKEFAIEKISLWKNAASAAFQSYTVTGRFDNNYEATIACNAPFDADDTLIVKVDVWTDSVDTDTSYHMTGLELVIPPNGLIFKNGATRDTVFADAWIANPSIDSATGLWTGSPDYVVKLDLYPPTYDVTVNVLDTTCADLVNIGDRLEIIVDNANEQIQNHSIKVDLSKFGLSSTYELRKDANHLDTNGTATHTDDVWTDTVRVGASTLDVIAGYVIYFTAKDNAGNTGTVAYQFTEPIDDIAPKFDSLKFYISGNYTGSDTSAALGDKLTLIAYMTSNGYFEIASVTATDVYGNFRSDTTSWELDDVTNGNNIWRVDIWLTNPLPRDLPVGDTILKHIWLTAVDNACNGIADTLVNFDPAIDIEPPVFSSSDYHTITNADSSSCTNLGDSVRVLADMSGNADIVRVYGDFLDAGINGSNEEDLADLGTGEWAKRWKVGDRNDPTKDPDPLYAKGPGLPDPDLDYTVKLWAYDDAGNWDTLRTGALTAVVGGGAVPLDTRRPFGIVVDDVTIHQLPAGKLQLKWPADYPSQATDAQWFWVYVDSTGEGFDFDNVFGTTFNTEYSADTNAWTSEYLTDSKTYRFVVRTEDACGNPEFNTNVFQAEADAKAPIACVVYPDTGLYWGPLKPLNITATLAEFDLDSAWITYRRLDIPSSTWGPWVTWRGANYMTEAGQTLYEDVALGTAPGTKGYYELYILTKDLAGNVLPLDSAQEHCSKFTFYWNPDVLAADIVSINGATSPQTSCGFDVWRDSVNTAIVSVMDPVADSIYTIDSWVIYYYAGDPDVYDSVRIEFNDLQAVPYTYTFSVADWPKSNDGIPTKLYVMITDTRNNSFGIDSVTLCVPDEVAPDIYMTYPTAYQRVPIAKSSLNAVPVRAKIGSTAYDPDSPVRVEFFYALDAATLTWVKIDETGTPIVLPSKGVSGSTALIGAYPEYEVEWNNSGLAEGFVWLKAIVHDDKDNTAESPAIKVYLDGSAPLMELKLPDAVMVNGMWTIKTPDQYKYIDLVAEITNNNIDIANVEFFISYRDSVDLVKFYHKIGDGYAGTENSIWRYRWYIDDWSWFKCGYDYKLRLKVTDIAGNVYDDNDGDGQFDDYTFWANPFAAPIELNTPADLSKMIFRYDCGAPQVAISEVVAGDRTYETPSSKLGGPAEVYMKMGETLTVKSVVLDSLFDLGGVQKVEYFFYSPVYDDYQSVGFATASPFSVSFDPFALGLITQDDVYNNEYDGTIRAVLTDSLNQTTYDDITCWVLDNFPGEAKWRTPNSPYVWGTVDLSIWALNGEGSGHYGYRQVVYKYKPAAGGNWTTIATVAHSEGADNYFTAPWPTLNVVPDGSYILGFESTDKNLNVQPVEDNPQITVTVQNALPTVTIKSPEDGAFFCESQYFTAEVTNGPVGTVDFQYKSVTSASWTGFDGASDNFPPFGKYFDNSLSDGYYHFRAYATNQAGRTAYSEPITLFYDGTAPLARITDLKATLDGETDTVDVEWKNDGYAWVNKAIGVVNVTAVAFDTLSPVGAQSIYNSGVAWVGLYLTTPGGPDWQELGKWYAYGPDSGYYSYNWDISGLPEGQYTLYFEAWDYADCNYATDTVGVYITEFRYPVSLVAGYWHNKIVGMTDSYNGPVQFQYKKGSGDWIPIGIGYEVASKEMNVYDGVYRDYYAYAADWAPADGSYDLRLLTWAGDEYAPVLSVTIANGVATVTSNPASGFPDISIERSLENNNVVWDVPYPEDCEVLGIARIASSNGYPYGIAMDYNVENEEYSYNIVPFRALPQQGTTTSYGGPFEFWGLDGDDGGYGSGQVFVFDYSGTVGYSRAGHMDTYWITRDFGSGGPISYYDGSITVTVPQEWTDDNDGVDNSLLLWKAQMARPSLYQDYWITPVGDANGMMNYIGNPGCWDNCGDDGQYAIIKMSYDPTCNLPEESLMVGYWDGEGGWSPVDIYFPSTVEGFNTTNHTVEFAVECLNEYYSVVKPTTLKNTGGITRMDILPMCNGYTGGYPSFGYQFRETWAYQVDWSTLEVKLDGVRIYTDANYTSSPAPKNTSGATALDDWALGWEFEIDEAAARLYFDHYAWGYYYQDDDSYLYFPPIACGTHELSISVLDEQGRSMQLTDQFMVDCTKPVVHFDNSYVGKNPTINFSVTDAESGVDWDNVFVDVFFVTKYDTTAGGGDYATPKERVAFAQTFFPDQIRDYRTGDNVSITTTYELDDERAILAVVYDGVRSMTYYDGYYYDVDPGAYDQFDEFYANDDGVPDCADNHASPFMQYLSVDYEAPKITLTSTAGSCPMVFRVLDDGSGFTDADIEIRENGVAL